MSTASNSPISGYTMSNYGSEVQGISAAGVGYPVPVYATAILSWFGISYCIGGESTALCFQTFSVYISNLALQLNLAIKALNSPSVLIVLSCVPLIDAPLPRHLLLHCRTKSGLQRKAGGFCTCALRSQSLFRCASPE